MVNNLGEDLLRYRKNQKYVVLDFETENLNLLVNNKPFQCSFIIADGNQVYEKFDNYIWWDDLNVSPGAQARNKFDRAKYEELAKPATEVLDLIDSYLYNPEYRILWFNGLNFDIYMHNILRLKTGHSTDYSFLKRTIDVNCLAKAYKLEIDYSGDGSDFIPWQRKLSKFVQRGLKTNLELLCKEFNIPTAQDKTFHDALADSEYTYSVFGQLINEISIK